MPVMNIPLIIGHLPDAGASSKRTYNIISSLAVTPTDTNDAPIIDIENGAKIYSGLHALTRGTNDVYFGMEFADSDIDGRGSISYLSIPAPPYNAIIELIHSSDDTINITGTFAVSSFLTSGFPGSTSYTRGADEIAKLYGIRLTGRISNIVRSSAVMSGVTTDRQLIAFFDGGTISIYREVSPVPDPSINSFRVYGELLAGDSSYTATFNDTGSDGLTYNADIRVRWDERIQPGMDVIFDGRMYKIISIDLESRYRFMRLALSLAEEGGPP